MINRVRCRLGVLASAVALLGNFASMEAHALALGRITVQSALGEPLRAEIDIAEINAEEAASLKAGPASADAFRAAGLEYTSAVVDLQVSLQKRPDGRAYLRLSSTRPVTEPFVDLILETNWSSGRIVRDYTMLFDPPNLRRPGSAGSAITSAPPAAPTAPILSRPSPSAAGMGTIPYSPPAAVAVAPNTKPKATQAPVAAASGMQAKPAVLSGRQQVTVKAGDTAGKIAALAKPVSVSLDQMMVALLRNNPEAFIGGNINRLKSGAVLDLPSSEEAAATTSGNASQTIIAQAKDFNDFRRKLAENVPAAQIGAANRQAAGQVQARVEDRGPATAAPDKLTLSKGAVQSQAVAEEKIAKERQAKEASARVAELSKNIGDLNKIVGAPAPAASSSKVATAPAQTVVPAPAAVPSKPSPVPAITVPVPAVPAVPVAAALPASGPALSPATASLAKVQPATATMAPPTPATTAAGTVTSTTAVISPSVVPASAAGTTAASATPSIASTPAAPLVSASSTGTTTATPVKAPVVLPPPPPPEPGLIDQLTENPLILPGLAALLLLLAGFGVYRFRQRNNLAQVDSSFLESRLQPDSFFGASGGQRVDTNEGGATGSSLAYSPSQLDAAGDVDPVAEADVYLAYGRDLQAEEILKEALRTTPNRVAIHSKLMEIYAKRRDLKAFEVIAVEAFNLTHGEGQDWAYIAEMGRELDPGNAMYEPGGQPISSLRNAAAAPVDSAAAGFGASTIPQMVEPEHKASDSVDFDLDLDFSIGDEPEPVLVKPTASVPAPEPTVALKPMLAPVFDGLDMDFGTGTMALKPTAQPLAQAPEPLSFDLNEADAALSASGLTFTTEPPLAPKPATQKAAAVMDSGMLEFDLGSLSLELDEPVTEGTAMAVEPSVADSPLETKFALAEEFRALGDMEGARSLAEEVMSNANGSLKTRAQAFLNALT